MRVLHTLLLATLLCSCSVKIQNGKEIKQGIAGRVLFWEGDFMPMIGKEGSEPKGWNGENDDRKKPVVRQVFIHELTSMKVLKKGDRVLFYREIPTKLVAETWTDSTGNFAVSLPVGEYSVFIREDSLFHATGADGVGNLWPVEVKKDSVTETQLNITYKATF